MGDFIGEDLSRSRFSRVDLEAAEFRSSSLARARFHGVDLSGVVMRGVELVDVRIDGEISNLLINGVDVAPLVDAELDRRDPDRARMRPTDPAGCREAWDIVERLWEEMPDTPGIPRDRAERPSLDVVLALRRDRMSTVRRLVDDLTDESLSAMTEPVRGGGWPPSESLAVRECLLIVLNEEWHHRKFAERDLDVLVAP